jgi:hypothetical protein
MSRISTRSTRSVATNFLKSNDENAAPKMLSKRVGLGNAVPAKPGVANNAAAGKSRRTVLGDISNRAKVVTSDKEDRMVKKTRVVTGHRTSKDDTKDATFQETGKADTRRSLDAMVENVNMSHDSDTSLENSVADLKLSSVDAADAENPQAAAEYMVDIMKYLMDTEASRVASANYMSKQSDINAKMREILVDWLVEVHLKFKLQSETLFLTVNLIDRFLERRAVSRTKLQLVGCTAMLIASKYEEIYAPEVRDFVYISDKAYTRDQILAMESIVLNTLGFHVTVPSILRFAERFAKVAKCDEKTTNLAKYLIELTLQDYKFLNFLPSQIGASAVNVAMKMTGDSSPWNSTLEKHTTYTESQLSECCTEISLLCAKDPPKYRAVRKKYASPKFDEVSLIPALPTEEPSYQE